jgi:hypothetical protein
MVKRKKEENSQSEVPNSQSEVPNSQSEVPNSQLFEILSKFKGTLKEFVQDTEYTEDDIQRLLITYRQNMDERIEKDKLDRKRLFETMAKLKKDMEEHFSYKTPSPLNYPHKLDSSNIKKQGNKSKIKQEFIEYNDNKMYYRVIISDFDDNKLYFVVKSIGFFGQQMTLTFLDNGTQTVKNNELQKVIITPITMEYYEKNVDGCNSDYLATAVKFIKTQNHTKLVFR